MSSKDLSTRRPKRAKRKPFLCRYDVSGKGSADSNGWIPTQSKFNVAEYAAHTNPGLFLASLPGPAV
jgi:hypothetical protein